MRLYRQHQVIKSRKQTSKMTAQYRFYTYLIKITMILTKVYVDITDLFLSLILCIYIGLQTL